MVSCKRIFPKHCFSAWLSIPVVNNWPFVLHQFPPSTSVNFKLCNDPWPPKTKQCYNMTWCVCMPLCVHVYRNTCLWKQKYNIHETVLSLISDNVVSCFSFQFILFSSIWAFVINLNEQGGIYVHSDYSMADLKFAFNLSQCWSPII